MLGSMLTLCVHLCVRYPTNPPGNPVGKYVLLVHCAGKRPELEEAGRVELEMWSLGARTRSC